MCGRFTLRTPQSKLATQFLFDLNEQIELTPRYNIAPTQDVAVVIQQDGSRKLEVMRWGLVPFWAKDLSQSARMINCRAETADTKPAFRAAFKKRRGLVIADGYYEWLREGKQKKPIYYTAEDEQPIAFASLWETWKPEDADESPVLHSCTILTTTANTIAAEVHDRMPVILDEAGIETWLDPNAEPPLLKDLLHPAPEDLLTSRPVNDYVNNARHEGKHCLDAPDQTLF